MVTNTDYNVVYFDTDDDLYKYVVIPQIVQREYTNNAGETAYYGDFDLNPVYYDDLDKSVVYVVKDPNSQILKHNGVVSYRTISKKLDNVKPWYYEKIYDKKQLNNGN